MKLHSRYIDRREYNLILILLTVASCLLAYVGLDKLAAKVEADNAMVSPVGRDLMIVERIKPVEVVREKLVAVSKKTLDCQTQHPKTAEKIRMYFSDEYPEALDLFCRESSLDHTAINPSSGACGLVQSLPCEKMGCSLNDLDCQLSWGKAYIENRYGTVSNAVAFHNSHNWY